MRNWIILCLLALVASGCERQPAAKQEAAAPEGLSKGVDRSQAGRSMPDAQLLNGEDEAATLSDLSGEPLLVNMWAGAPRVIAVAVERAERPSVEAFLEQHGVNDLESWRDQQMALSGALGVQVMPTTVYYDATGREVWRYIGDLDWTGEEAAKLLAEAGARKP